MLSSKQIQAYYLNYPFRLPDFWTLGRRHLRVMLRDGRFVKLNHFENRLTEKDLRALSGPRYLRKPRNSMNLKGFKWDLEEDLR